MKQITGHVFLIFLAFGLGVEASIPSKKGLYLVPDEYKQHLQFRVSKSSMKKVGPFWQVPLDLDTVESFSHTLHHKKFGCGGFFEITGEDQKRFFKKESWVKSFEPREIRFPQVTGHFVSLLDKSSYKDFLEKITDFTDRSARTEHGRKATQWFVDQAQQQARFYGRQAEVEVETVVTGSRYTQDSVVIKLKGQADQPGVLVGAHMDTYARNKPGADDDGSGSAAVMEIFRVALASKLKFKRDLYFVLYAAEELGLVGSKQVVNDFLSKKKQLVGVMQLDMIGYRSPNNDKDIYFVEDNVNANLTDFSRKLSKEILGLTDENLGVTRCGYACSDHASWHRKGYSAVLPFEATMGTYNRSIHTGNDTIANLDLDHAMTFVRLGGAFMSELGEPVKVDPAR